MVDKINKINLSIIIVTYNSSSLIKKCLEPLLNLNNINYEIIVVDNESKDNTLEILKNYNKKIRIYVLKNKGYANALNFASKKAKGEYLLFMNPDIFIEKEDIKKMLNRIKKDKNIGIIAPKLIFPNNKIQDSCFMFYKFYTPFLRRSFLGRTKFGKKHIDKIFMKNSDKNKEINPDWVLGAIFIMERNFFEKISGMDSRFFLYYEDMDICKRCHLNNKKILYFPYAKAIHNHIRSSANYKNIMTAFLNKVTREHIKSYIKYHLKFLGR
ncbi:glycosyltransferase family 2 protein [Patescibacteria group bacterium]|nr:glycosyltransferase family 2 protein [Patescibacteria group bacterium]